MNEFQRWKLQVSDICDQAMNGLITIEEFYERWPDELRNSNIAQLIYEDLEDGIQHFPGKLLSGKPDIKGWQLSEMYQRIVIDKKILKGDQSEELLIVERRKLLTEAGLSQD